MLFVSVVMEMAELSSPDLAGGTDCRSRDYRWWCMNYGQESPVHQQDGSVA